MKYTFTNKVIWITGASSGIGEALAYALSARDAKLVLSSRREAELERVKNNCAHPNKVQILPLDLADGDSLEEKVPAAIALFRHIDMMVHNGGITQRSFAIETAIAVHRKVMELDYFSYIILTKALLPHFIERRSGYFVITSSVLGKFGTQMRGAYAAAKHALHGYFDCLRAEVSQYGIKVTIITPGYISTNSLKSRVAGDGSTPDAHTEQTTSAFPAGKAAAQIIKNIEKGNYEAYVGKPMGQEKLALLFTRFLPRVLKKLMPKIGG